MPDDIIKQSFIINLYVMRILRLYPPETNTRLYKLQAYVLYSVFIVLVPLLTAIYIFVEDNIDILQINYSALFLAQTACFTVKLLPFIENGNKIKECINYFGAPGFEQYGNEQRKIVDECIKICRRNSLVYLTGIIVATISWIVRPLFFRSYKLPLDVWLPFNVTSEPMIYYLTFAFFAAAAAYVSFSGTIIDPLIAGLIYHAASQVKVLKHNLQNLNNEEIWTCYQENIVENEKVKKMYDKIKKCIDHHNAILNFVNLCEECFSLSVFSQCSGSLFSICFCCLQLSMTPLTSFNGLSSVMYILVILGQLFFYCYYGTQLFEESHSLNDAVYMGHWYEYEMKSRKALIVLMERTKRPMIVTAGKIMQLTLKTFMTTINRTYSLIAVLKNYQ